MNANPGEQAMIATDTLQRLFRYKAWANEALLAAMERLDATAPSTEIAIRALSHTYVVDRIFAANLRKQGHDYASANASRAPALTELSEAIRASDRWYIDYVAALDEAQLAERIDFTFTDGAPGRMSREEMLMHLIIHGGYHRGQVGWIMTLSDVAVPADGLTSYLHEAEAATRRRLDAPGEPAGPAPIARAVCDAPQPAEAPAKEAEGAKAMSRLEELTGRMKIAVGADAGLGKTLKFDLRGEGFIFIDGGSVTNEDRPADLTLSVSIDDLRAIGQGRLAPMAAVMTRRLGISDMGVAIGLQGRMKALFANMPKAG